MWVRWLSFIVVLLWPSLFASSAHAQSDTLTCQDLSTAIEASDLSVRDCAFLRLPFSGSPHILVVWVADPAIADTTMPSFARALEDSLAAYYRVMTNGKMNPIVIRARRAGADSIYAFVADSSFASYRNMAPTDQAGRIGIMNYKLMQEVCTAGFDFSGADMIAYIYNNNPFVSGFQLGEACLLKPVPGTVDTTTTLCNGRTVGWWYDVPGVSLRYRWTLSDAQRALSFELAHESAHGFQLNHSPGSESFAPFGTCANSARTYGYGHYSIMRSFMPVERNTSNVSTADMFPFALPDVAKWVTLPTSVVFDDAGRWLRDVRQLGPIMKVPIDSLTDEHYQVANYRSRRFDSVLHSSGLSVWRIKTRAAGPFTEFSCGLWDIESAVGRFTSGSPNAASGLDSLDFYLTASVPDTLKDYLGSGNDLYDGTVGRSELNGSTNPSTQAWSGTTRTSARNRYSNVAIKNIVTVGDSVRADFWVGYDTLTVTSAIDSTQDAGPTMSPNGEMVAWSRGQTSGSDIYVESIEDHSDRHRMGFTNDADIAPSWDPFSGRVAFASDSTGQFEIYTGQYNGLGVTKLTSSTSGAFSPAWSTKGDSITYLEEDEYGQTRIMKISAFGGTARALTEFADPGFGVVFQNGVSWSPDAAKLSYLRNDSLFTMDAVGGNQTFLVTGALPRGSTSWSPDGDWIAYIDVNNQLRRVKISNTSENTRWTVSGRGRFSDVNYQPWGTRIGVTHWGATGAGNDIWTYRFVEDEAPVLDSVGTRTVAPGATLTINLGSSDPDGDYVAYNGFFLPSGASFSGNTFSWTPSGGQVGVYKVKFRVIDLVSSGGVHKGGADHEWVTINVSGGGGCPFVDTRSSEGWVVENSILGRSLDNELANDVLQLKFDPQRVENTYSVRIRENENEETTLDQASLIGVDHDPNLRVFRRRGEYVLGNQVPAYRVTNAAGRDITQLVDGSQESPFIGEPGETLTVDLVEPALRHRIGLSSAGQRLQDEEDPPVLNSGGKEIDPDELRRGTLATQSTRSKDALFLEGTGIVYQVPDGDGGWQNVERIYPRADYAESVPDSVNSSTFRLVFVGRHQINFIGRLARAEAEPTIVTAELASAMHTRLGDVREGITSAGSGSTSLTPRDTLNLGFTAVAPTEGNERTWFLLTRGVYTTIESQLAGGGRGPGMTVVPLVYSLGSARPNPSTGWVAMQYSLAKPGRTTLRIYSGSGRLVRTLVDGDQPAGNYEAIWDGKSSAGARLGAGVYFYRLSSGGWKAEKKVTLLSL